jgi:hypothetical protein
MKKIILISFFLILFLLISSIIILSTIGIETNKFNNLITKKIILFNNKINLSINTIRFKLDIKELSLFLETSEPKINYRETAVPIKTVKVYIDFFSIIISNLNIAKINLKLDELNINELKKISLIFKPSNLNSIINNKINQGKLISEIDFYFDKNNSLQNFIARGHVINLKAKITNNLYMEKTKFNFFADKSDILIKNILGEIGPIKITEGDVKLNFSPEVKLASNFKTKFRVDEKAPQNFKNFIKKFKITENLTSIEADLNNTFLIDFDKTYKVKNYSYKNNGKIIRSILDLKIPLKDYISEEYIKKISLNNSELKTSLDDKNKNIILSGKYSINNSNFLNFNLENNINKSLSNFKVKAEYDKEIDLNYINYKKPKNYISDLYINVTKKKNNFEIEKFNFNEGKSTIVAENVKFKDSKFLSLKKVYVKTFKKGKINNDFSIISEKKIGIKGRQFDASNFPKIISQKKSSNIFYKLSKNIEIDFENIIAPLSENLKNFKLIGEINKGKFVKISSKGDFGSNNYLDIAMKNDKKNKRKYLEIYSDLTRPLLTEYNFFKGLSGGKLLFSSIIDEDKSNSKLKIENFKVINAPGVVKLLSLADLGGLADLAEGEGLSFDILEIKMEKNKGLLKLNEIIALGPSVSVLMEGYQEKEGLTSLRGTLVPAKTLNKMIAKIPVIGNIVIPKEVGEGLFGISFKMKGTPGKIKTSINPIKTLTPRFIQKIIDKKKFSK